MSDLPFGIEARNTYAALSPADLQSLGKRACVAYLGSGVSLNDAIIKIAREYPSISPHQVQRVIEYANQETFAKLFSDNEKYASDKNIEFDVADPGYILLELNNGARPSVMMAPPDEYSSSPVKMAHSNVEADIELARVFGFDPALPGTEKTAYAQLSTKEDGSYVVERVLSTFSKSANANGDQFLNRILSVGKMKHADVMPGMAPQAMPMEQPQPQQQAPAEDDGNSHNTQMLALQREIELSKKRQELQKVQQQTLDAMNPQGQPGSVTAPGMAPPVAATGEVGPDAGAAMAPEGGGPVDGGQAPQEQMPQEQQKMPPAAAGAIMAPPGGEGIKMGSIVKQAMEHVKVGRPHARLLQDALSGSVSFERIKEATAGRGQYPMANPYGNLIRSKQKIAKLLEDATYARDKNVELYKEASMIFQKEVAQHLWNGGNLGEVAHLMSSVNGSESDMKTVLASAMPELVRQGLDPVKARAQMISYEMEKGASSRVPNSNHPIARTYGDLLKLAEGDSILKVSCSRLQEQYRVVDVALREVMAHAS
jgi:hypothetical protein